MSNIKLSLKDRYYIFKYIFKLEMNIILMTDIEFRSFIKAVKLSIWLSIIFLILNTITVSIGYYS